MMRKRDKIIIIYDIFMYNIYIFFQLRIFECLCAIRTCAFILKDRQTETAFEVSN
jgi:hypothetical protein